MSDVTTKKEMAENVMVNVSDQVNSVVNNLAGKLEAPAEAVQGIAKYGFEKYVEFVSAAAIGELVTDGILIIFSILLGIVSYKTIKIIIEKGEDYTDDESFIRFIASTVCGFASLIMFIIVIQSLTINIPRLLAPEGAVIKDVIEQVSPKEKTE